NKATSGSFSFYSNASNSALVVTVSGTGIAAGTLAATPSTLGFGRIPIGSSTSKTLTVTNPGSSAITVTQISTNGGALANPFTTSGIAAPLTLAAGQSITFQVTFAPQNLGDFFGNLSLVSSNGGQ